jgi:acetyl esterase/lipase
MVPMTAKPLALALILATTTSFASAQQQVIPLWPHGTPEPPQSTTPESDKPAKNPHYPGVALNSLSDVAFPTMTVFPVPAGVTPTGAAAVVFPGGGYQHLAFNLEGIMPCQWFNSLGIFCVAVKYRIPWDKRYPDTFGPLEDAQQAVRMVRARAEEWHLDPHRIGVMGFSAGGHLAVVLSQHFDDDHILSTPAAKDADATISARPDFAILGYPAYLPVPAMNTATTPGPDAPLTLDPVLAPNKDTPPTFLVQAENDIHYVDSSLAYFRALKNAGIPAELLIFPDGAHGFGMHPSGVSPQHWTDQAAAFLHTEGILNESLIPK